MDSPWRNLQLGPLSTTSTNFLSHLLLARPYDGEGQDENLEPYLRLPSGQAVPVQHQCTQPSSTQVLSTTAVFCCPNDFCLGRVSSSLTHDLNELSRSETSEQLGRHVSHMDQQNLYSEPQNTEFLRHKLAA